ncbi:MAG: flippase-like domain-containing protein [Proteobacteria bacterium]|nr:flippase-like domain-containing protein [Pseudomonadota bacterium]
MSHAETNKIADNIALKLTPHIGNKTFVHSRLMPAIKNILPWIAVFAIFSYLFWDIDKTQFLTSLSYANIYTYVPGLIVFGMIAFLLDTQNLYAIFNHFKYNMKFTDILPMRGVTYLLMIINFNLGMGGILYFLKRDQDISIKRGTGLMLIYNTATQNSLFILSIIGCLIAPHSDIIRKILIFSIICVSVNFLWVAVLKKLPDRGNFSKFKTLAWVKVYHEIPFNSYLLITFWRCVYYSTFILFFYLGVRAFNMAIPLLLLTAYVPIILLIISLPVTPFGLGTSQAAMILFFKDFGSEANILAFGITYSTSVIIIRGIIGLFYLKKSQGIRSIKRGIQMENANEKI